MRVEDGERKMRGKRNNVGGQRENERKTGRKETKNRCGKGGEKGRRPG
jgi:hypothetical protein